MLGIYTGFDWGRVLILILGDMAPEVFVAHFLAMCGGALVFFTLDVKQSISSTHSGPTTFSWGYMIRDNFFRVLGVLVLIMATVIWYDSFFGVPLNAKLAFMQGLSIDALIGMILKQGKQRGPMAKSRAKLQTKYKSNG